MQQPEVVSCILWRILIGCFMFLVNLYCSRWCIESNVRVIDASRAGVCLFGAAGVCLFRAGGESDGCLKSKYVFSAAGVCLFKAGGESDGCLKSRCVFSAAGVCLFSAAGVCLFRAAGEGDGCLKSRCVFSSAGVRLLEQEVRLMDASRAGVFLVQQVCVCSV